MAPDAAPVATTAIEQAKGTRDWTDNEAKPLVVDPIILAQQAKIAADRHEALSMTVGHAIPKRKVASNLRPVSLGHGGRP